MSAIARCGCTSTCACVVSVADTASLDLTITGDGSSANPYVISGVASANVEHADTPCITLTGTGSALDPLTATIVTDPACDLITCDTDGLCVTPTVVTVLDTASLDLTLTGTGTAGDPYVISGLAAGTTFLQTLNTQCIDMTVTGTGTSSDPYIISADPIIAPDAPCNGLECTATGLVVAPSTDAGNTLTCGTDGNLFVPAAGTVIVADNTDESCVDVTVVEAPLGTFTISAAPVLDPDLTNQLVCGTGPSGDGLYVPPAASATVVQADNTDETCVDVTVVESPVGTFNISAAPIVAPDAPCNGLSCTAAGLVVAPSTDAGNALTCGTDGNLFAPTAAAAAITVADTACINLSGDGTLATPLSADPIVDPSAQNALTCGAAGLLVDVAALALDTNCINTTVTGNGTVASPFVISADPIIAPDAPCNGVECTPTGLAVIPSADAGNNLACGTDGRLYVPTGAATITTADTPCIAVNGDGSAGSPVTAVPIIDPSAQNALTCGAAGLLVDVAAVALDTTCINTTVTGNGTTASPFAISADPIIDPACGLLTCGAAGLCVAPTPVAVVDTPTVDLTLTGTGQPGNPWTISAVAAAAVTIADTSCINLTGNGTLATPLSADPIIDPTAGNLLTCEATGLRADVVTGPCGVSGAGTAADPIVANVATWPYPCAQDANAKDIYCSPTTGQLQAAPDCPVFHGVGGGPAPSLVDPVPLGATVFNQTFPAFVVNNPSTCFAERVGFSFAARVGIDYRDFGGVHNGFVNFQFSPDNLGWNNAVAQNNNWIGNTNLELDFTFPPNQFAVTIPAGGSQNMGTRYLMDPDGATNARALAEFGTITYQSLGCV